MCRSPEFRALDASFQFPESPPPVVFTRLPGPGRDLAFSWRHPYQEAFDHAAALAALADYSAEPAELLDAALESWTSRYSKEAAAWQQDPDVAAGAICYVHVDTGERSQVDPRRHMLRELQLGRRLIAALRGRTVPGLIGCAAQNAVRQRWAPLIPHI
mmetsp:Transcript_26744/g.84913  ORF Transcript_26744/g.84913 Transcript_26744/m.84913 type:complete len:158 (+) Transcript_26744:6-479(+)